MPADPRRGAMDNPYASWSPLPARPVLRWPGGAGVAVCVMLSVEHTEWLPPPGVAVPPSAVRRPPYPALPDPHEVSPHEYGNRVGVFRLIDALDRHGIPATVAIDAASAQRYPGIVERCRDRGWELVAHGLSASRIISGTMSEADELAYISRSLDAVEAAAGVRPRGWVGVDHAQSERTIGLLARAGVDYVCDWPNDDQPYALVGPGAGMVALPTAIELDDVHTMHLRHVRPALWRDMVVEGLDRLARDGERTGRVLVLGLHGWIAGQPHRMRYVTDVLAHLAAMDGAWIASASAIVDRFQDQRRPDGTATT